jgi:hypothetical protein
MGNISPGVYSKIYDLSEYVQQVPGTIGMVCGLSEKGEDNKLKFYGSRGEFLSEVGDPNITEFGKNFGQGPYIAYNFLGEAGSLLWMRCLPEDAAYSNLKISASFGPSDATASIVLSYVESADASSQIELKTALASVGTVYPLCILRPIGRGQYYNNLGVRFTEHSNPLLMGVYILDIYEKQSDGSQVIIESFEVSFDPTAKSTIGDSIYISYILEMYSQVLRAESILASGSYASGYDYVARVYDKNIGDVTVDLTAVTASLTDSKQVFTDWESAESGNASYMILAKDGKGNTLYGWLGAAAGTDDDTIHVFTERDLSIAARGWNGTIASFDENSEITYEIRKSTTSVASAFISGEIVSLKKGTDGSLRNATGAIDPTVATNILANAYAGTLTSPIDGDDADDVLDTDNMYFNLVFDAGYPRDVKDQIVTLCQTRRDCNCLVDNGDNATYSASITSRTNTYTYNNYFTAIYESYNKVYDLFTGQDIWVSPIWHLSYLAPRNDRVAEIWYAIAGYNRATIETIKDLRFNPKLGQRDQMYLKQINPIVKFAQGYTPFGQLTSQAKASALQDLNIVRMVLYCQRALSIFCKNYIFEMNDYITWSKVKIEIERFLDDIKRRRGLYDFSVDVGATEYELKSKQFHANIILNPTRVVERINLNFFIK